MTKGIREPFRQQKRHDKHVLIQINSELCEIWEDTLQKRRECLKMQREAAKNRVRQLAARQSEISMKALVMKQKVARKYQQIQAVLEEDLKVTLSHLDMEEHAAVSALDAMMEKNRSFIQEIEQDLIRLSVSINQVPAEPNKVDLKTDNRVVDLLERTDPDGVSLDEAKADQILSITDDMLLLVSSHTPTVRKLLQRYASEVRLDPDTAHPKLVVSTDGAGAAYTDKWQQVPDLPGRFDTTLNVISLQGYRRDRHYWEVDVSGKTYWELGVTYPTIRRKGTSEDCWLGRGEGSWCVEFFDGEYTAWHAGVPHQLPFASRFQRIGVLCSFPPGLVTFVETERMTPLYSFCAGAFSDCLHLALCPGHDHNGTNSRPIVICPAPPRTTASQ